MAQSDRVTDLIMHYYMQHGRNRDLEKYLRLRRMSSATRSSSDGSLPNLCSGSSGCAGAERSGAGRSMENLSTLRQEAERQELAEGEQSMHRKNASGGSGKSVSKSSNNSTKQADGAGEAVGGDAAKGVTVREKKVEQKSGRNFNFNLESVIEINLPPPPTITIAGSTTAAPIAPPSIMCSQMAAAPLQPPASTSEKRDHPPFRLVVHENSTQTPVTPEDDPIRPVVKPSSSTALPVGGNEETLDSTKDLSPGSSVASNRQKLEWDSLGDIGYDSSERLQFCGAADLNETEKRCLQRYFARKGLNFDRSVVVVRQREEKERKVAAKAAAQQEASIVLANPGAQSTPKPSASATGVTAKQEAAKATQTSLRPSRPVESRGIQAVREGQPQRDREDKGIGTESCTMASVDAAESFEFFPRSAPETGTSNGGTSVASLSTTSHHSSSNSTSSSGAGPSSATLRPTFDDEVKLGLTLYNSIQELSSMPTGVKQSLIDKIFRKLSRHDPKRRTREQLLQDYATAVRERRTGLGSAPPADQANVYDDVSPSGEHDVPSGSNPRPEQREELDRSLGVEELVVDETKDPEDSFPSEENDAAVEGSVQGLSSGSNDAQNAVPTVGDIAATSSAGGLCSIQTVSSSHQESVGTAKENLPQNEPAARDKRVRQAMQDYLRPMTHSEVEYENFKELQKRAQRAKEPQLAQIDREIEQLLVRKMLLLSADTDRRTVSETDKGLTAVQQRTNALPSERSGTVYTSVHESTSGSSGAEPNSSGRASKDSSAWNSHYHMAKLIKTRSKLETPTSPSDVSIPTFIKQKKDQFIENYDQVRHERRVFEEQNHIYTRPYSGQRSDVLRRQEKENRALARGKYVKDKLSKPIPVAQTDRRMIVDSSSNVSVPSPRLLDGCAGFISSDSISIPVVTTLTNTTTTHHYDIKSRRPSPPVMPAGRTAGTQTTDSILRTKPIFGEQRAPPQKTNKAISTAAASVQVSSSGVDVPVHEANGCRRTRECHCMCGRLREAPRKTELIDGTAGRQDKQAQTKPSSIAYVITFEGGSQSERRPSATNARTKTGRTESQLTVSSSPTVSESDEEGENGKDNVSEKMLTLREQFSRSCPTTLTRIEERRRCIGELNKLRSKRNAQRQRLLLLTSDDSLRRTKVAEGKSKLPPPPLTSKWRVFASTRAMRENTRRQVRNLPEVLRKKELERMNNLKRKNLIMKDVYNRNLQRKVLRGQVDLSNSVRVIQD